MPHAEHSLKDAVFARFHRRESRRAISHGIITVSIASAASGTIIVSVRESRIDAELRDEDC